METLKWETTVAFVWVRYMYRDDIFVLLLLVRPEATCGEPHCTSLLTHHHCPSSVLCFQMIPSQISS